MFIFTVVSSTYCGLYGKEVLHLFYDKLYILCLTVKRRNCWMQIAVFQSQNYCLSTQDISSNKLTDSKGKMPHRITNSISDTKRPLRSPWQWRFGLWHHRTPSGYNYIVKKEAVGFFETLVTNYQTAWCHYTAKHDINGGSVWNKTSIFFVLCFVILHMAVTNIS